MIIEGKVAIVTGGAQSIGKAHVEALLQKGAKVCVADINDKTGLETVQEFKQTYGQDQVFFIKCDVTDNASIENAFSRTKDAFGRLDIVVNNAGIMLEENWELTFDINVRGVFRGTLLGMQYMVKDKGGSGGVIINMSSITGVTPYHSVPAYTASKYAVLGLSRSFGSSQHLEQTGVRVNSICPHVVKTDMNNQLVTSGYFPEGNRVMFESLKSTYGLIKPSRVAEAMIQLVEDDAKNGDSLMVLQNSELSFIKFQEFKPDAMPE